MTFSRLAGAGVVLLAAASFTPSQLPEPKPAEPQPAAPPAPPLHPLLDFVGDGAFQSELKLTPSQAKKLLALRQKLWDETYTTPPKDLTARQAERGKAVAAAFKDVLDAGQLKRAEQLAWQHVWRSYATRTSPFAEGPERAADPTRVAPLVLGRHPGLAAALHLSDDQKKLVPADRTVTSPMLLTAGQVETAREFLGPIANADWTAERDPRMTAVQLLAYPGTPALLRVWLDHRDELKLTDEQVVALGKPRPADFRYDPDISPEQALKQARERLAEAEKSLAKVLTPEQLTRARQLALREQHDPALGNAADPLAVSLADELAVTPEQRKKFSELRAAHARAVARTALADDFTAARRGIRAADGALAKGLADGLTADQRAKLKALVGEPVAVERAGLFRVRLTPAARRQREESFGRYTTELMLLYRNKSIQAELKMTADQIDLSRRLYLDQNRKFATVIGAKVTPEERDARAAAKSEFVGECLAAILDPRQAKRFRQIMIQHREYPDSRLSSATLATGAAYPGVAEELKLTDEQQKRLIDGEHTLDVLTDEQHKALKEMLGERFTGDYKTTITTTPKTPTAAATAKAEHERTQFLTVMPWQALDLEPEQVTKLAEAVNRHRAAVKGTAAGTLKADVKQILADPKALVRVEQLMLQSRAAHNLRDAFDQPGVAKALQLSPAQLTRVADLEEEAGDLVALVVQSPLRLADRDAVLRRLRDKLDDRTLAVLTPEQAAKWKELTGDPYPGFAKTLMRAPVFRPSR